MNDFWPGPEKPFSLKFWLEVRREKKLLKKCKKFGHDWMPMTLRTNPSGGVEVARPLVMECSRCGNRRPAGDSDD